MLLTKGDKCPACGANDWTPEEVIIDHSVSGKKFHLLTCNACNLRVTSDAPAQDEIGPYYQSEDYISHSDVKKDLKDKLYHRARSIMLGAKARWVESAVPGGKASRKLLDVGCGTGYFAQHMQERSWSVLGLEPDDGARGLAAKRGLEVKSDTALMDLHVKEYDAITMWHVLEHVHRLDDYLQKYQDLLRDDGVLVIAVPNHTSYDAKYYGLAWAAYDVPRHLWHFSPQSMESFLRKHGFNLKAKKRMLLDPFYVSLLSEKYKNGSPSLLKAGLRGLRSTMTSFADKDKSSSLVYIAQKQS